MGGLPVVQPEISLILEYEAKQVQPCHWSDQKHYCSLVQY
jgi:hypothetical protein